MALRQVKDTPTNNFATWNPLENAQRNAVLSNGNLKTTDSTTNWSVRFLNLVPTKGMYYVEFYIQESATTTGVGIIAGNGMRTWPENYGDSGYPYDTNTFGHFQNGSIYHNNSAEGYGFSFSDGDVVSMIIDYTTRNFWVRVNNNIVSGDNHVTGSQSGGAPLVHGYSELPKGDMYVYCCQRGQNDNSAQSQMYLNAGQDHTFLGNKSGGGNHQDANGLGSFYYEPPAGTLALCSRNIQSVEQDGSYVQNYVSAKGNFRAVTYTGTGNLNKISCGIQPDLVWVKQRHGTTAPVIADSIRGPGNFLNTDSNSDEHNAADGWFADEDSIGSSGETITLTQFTDTGFNVGDATNWNQSGGEYVAWTWKAGGAPLANDKAMVDGEEKTITGDEKLDAGSITPTRMSVNTKAGFSIIKYSGQGNDNDSIPHGLTKEPDVFIYKKISAASGWMVKLNPKTNAAVSNENQYLYLNLTNPFGTNSSLDGSGVDEQTIILPDTIKFTKSAHQNENGVDLIAYCWHSVPGYSAFGSYTGNSTTDNTFVYTGFKPAFIMLKCTGSFGSDNGFNSWTIVDNARSQYNPVDIRQAVWANSNNQEGYRTGNNAESNFAIINFLSNGFKIIDSSYEVGQSQSYIYMAFAEQPGAFSNAR